MSGCAQRPGRTSGMTLALAVQALKDARIAILTCPFEPPKPKTKHKVDIDTVEKFEALRATEQQYFKDMVQRCKASGERRMFRTRACYGASCVSTPLPSASSRQLRRQATYARWRPSWSLQLRSCHHSQ